MKDRIHCSICSSVNYTSFDDYSSLNRVTSDCKPWNPGGKLCQCANCGSIYKPLDDRFVSDTTEIYKNYNIGHQSSGEEQLIFNQSTGEHLPRSQIIYNQLVATIGYFKNKRILDVGCGRGATIKAFFNRNPSCKYTGFDLNARFEHEIRNIHPEISFASGNFENVPCKQDIISIIHVLEHVYDVTEFLHSIHKLLTDDGWIVINVPNVITNPFDIIVADHRTHFTPDVLRLALSQAGFNVVYLSDNIIRKELIVIAKRVSSPKKTEITRSKEFCNVYDIIKYLTNYKNFAHRLATDNKYHLNHFGASIITLWTLLETNFLSKCIIDEDTKRRSSPFFGIPVVSLSQLDSNDILFITQPYDIALSIYNRLIKQNPLCRYAFYHDDSIRA